MIRDEHTDIELREAVNKVISAFNEGDRDSVCDHGADVLQTYFPGQECYDQDFEILQTLLHVFNENDLGMIRKEVVNKDFVYGW